MTICDYCCEYLGIKMIEGVHRPYDDNCNITFQDEIYDIQQGTKNLTIEKKQTIKADKVSIKFLIFII